MSKYDNDFLNEYDLVECLKRGCEVEFSYNRKKYSITHIDEGISVMEFNNDESEKVYPVAHQVLEYKVGHETIRDIISKMKVIDRSF